MRLLRTLTPLGWMALAAGVLAMALTALGALGFRWDPFDLGQRRVEAAEARAAAGDVEATSRRLEAQGGADQLRRLDQFQHQRTAVERTTATAVEQARNADDSEVPVDPGRADRLRRHDGELCRLAADLDGCAGAAAPAGSGVATVRPGDPSA